MGRWIGETELSAPPGLGSPIPSGPRSIPTRPSLTLTRTGSLVSTVTRARTVQELQIADVACWIWDYGIAAHQAQDPAPRRRATRTSLSPKAMALPGRQVSQRARFVYQIHSHPKYVGRI